MKKHQKSYAEVLIFFRKFSIINKELREKKS